MNRPDQARDRLLTVARHLFATRGYDATSVRAITRKARANLGAVTYHFGSKRDLYFACIDSFAEPLAERIEQAAASPGSGLDRVEAIVRTVLEHFGRGPGMPAILLRELTDGRPLSPPIVRVMKRNVTNLVRTVAAGQRDRSIRPGDPALLALSAMAQPFYMVVAGRLIRQVAGLNRDDATLWPRIVDHVATAVRHTLAPRPQAP